MEELKIRQGRDRLSRRSMPALAAGVLIAIVAAVPGFAAAGDTELVSRAGGAAGVQGNEDSFDPSLDRTGSKIAFTSISTNLHPDDDEFFSDVFVRDSRSNEIVLVSRPDGANGNTEGNADDGTLTPSGRYVAFTLSGDDGFEPGDDDFDTDVFRRDLQTDQNELVSRADGVAGADANAFSYNVEISANGRFVAFVSAATNLDPDDGDSVEDVYVRDLLTAKTELISRADGSAGAKANGECDSPSMSSDGRYVAMECDATNLDPADDDPDEDVYVRDRQTDQTILVSRGTGASGAKGNGDSGDPAMAADGTSVAFESTARNLDPVDTDAAKDVFVRKLVANVTEVVSRADGATGQDANADAGDPAISEDGTRIAFSSVATNLDAADTHPSQSILLRDLSTNQTSLVSRGSGPGGVDGNAQSLDSAISSDGAVVAFVSAADNLVAGDANARWDIFSRQVLGEPPVSGDACKKAKQKLSKAKKQRKAAAKKVKKAKKAGSAKKLKKAKKARAKAKKKFKQAKFRKRAACGR